MTPAEPPCSFSSGNAILDPRFPYVYGTSGLSSECTLSIFACEHIHIDRLTRSKVLEPPSPLHSECQSVTPRSQTYPDTPPVLDAGIFDSVPFSVSIYRRGVFDLGRNPNSFVVVGLVFGVSRLLHSRCHAPKRHHHPRHCPGPCQGCQAVIESSRG